MHRTRRRALAPRRRQPEPRAASTDANDSGQGGVCRASSRSSPPGSVQSKLGVVTFSLADLGVTNPTSVSTATGIRLSSSTLDPNVVGLYTVP